jgi:hypothetical protein
MINQDGSFTSSLTKKQQQAISAYRRAEKGALARVTAYCIISPDGSGTGKILITHAQGTGSVNAFVWDTEGNGLQHGKASGYGYDKVSAALQGIKFDSITFTDHPKNWESQLRDAGYRVIFIV